MGIFDEACGTADPFNTGRSDEFGKSLKDYGRTLADALAGFAGGDGGGLPESAPGIGGMSLAVDRNTDGWPQLDPVPETAVPAIKPATPVPITAPAAVIKPVVKTPNDSVFGKATRFLNRVAQPERQESSDTGTLGLRIQSEAGVDPQTATGMMNRMAGTDRAAGSAHAAVGMRTAPEARFNPDEAADALNRMAHDDREASAEAGAPSIRVLQEAKAAPGQPGKVADRVEPHGNPPEKRIDLEVEFSTNEIEEILHEEIEIHGQADIGYIETGRSRYACC